ncbi:lovastatin nonaketide synthase [Xylaria grammica]|nr:lovastatin nonaketide synthase [Xylaria grammica]
MTALEPIAIIGSACRFPGDTDTPSKLWELLRSPKDLLRRVPSERYDASAHYHPDPKHHGTTNVQESYFLEQDVSSFDHGFFNIQAGEAEAIDPQQRILLETVYDSLCAAGQTIEDLRGSSTAVYVGLMCDDWRVLNNDLDVFPQYGATGLARSIMSNRISYFFDWHGPSMTIDTACSSSLVAVHQAIQSLRSGESHVALACGANLILTPGMYVAESKLSMLSAAGRSRMWDKDVDGYARGEGIASVVLKTLSAAIRDNDHIECVIRATGINQDGRTPGLTMPSATAQAALIKDTYARAGLDVAKPEDRPQFFHAHGTGTPAGDPNEAEAIAEAFYSSNPGDSKLFVGSIKTIIGHTEGTAGLASLIGTSQSIQHGVIPPNMHFNELNPRIAPFYDHLQVPTKSVAWPQPHSGQPRRASINSFGFGGTNAHAIIESYEPRRPLGFKSGATGPLFSPLTFSASSDASLITMLSSYSDYLGSNPSISLHDLAYSLQTRLSTLTCRATVAASTVEDARSQIDAIVSGGNDDALSTRQPTKSSHNILGVFTGQGSQWPRMGAALLENSPYVARRLTELDQVLLELPLTDRPAWTLREMILAEANTSQMTEAAISQPLCTAVQIVLVDLLQLAGITLHAVVGHSSGEIAAAYCAGLVTASDAMKIAYYRGRYAGLARSTTSGNGTMMAVGTTFEDASEFCELEAFRGRIHVAARNSPSSITLSGDEDAIVEAIEVFQDEGKFARQLKVDTAYHSPHVFPCAEPYLQAIQLNLAGTVIPTSTRWFSSVRQRKLMTADVLGPQYWVDNMNNPVLFSPAIAQAWNDAGPFDLILEVGPHPVLKTPCLDTLEAITGEKPRYSGLLARGKNDVDALAKALGFIWTSLGARSVAFDEFNRTVSQSSSVRQFVTDLPKYSFDHSRQFMSLSRVSGVHYSVRAPPHPLLGRRCHDRETADGNQWRNILDPREISWLSGHTIQGQTIFPATGYISMAVEAVNIVATDRGMGLVSIHDLRIGRALAFHDDSSVEVLFDFKLIENTSDVVKASFACYSGAPLDPRETMALNASGIIEVALGSQNPDSLPPTQATETGTSEVEIDRFYNFLARLGYNYARPFRGTTSIQRKAEYATGTMEDQSGSDWEDQLIVHPGMLDTALQTTFAAFCCPGDERMWSIHVPMGFRSILINPYFTGLGIGKQDSFRYMSIANEFQNGMAVAELNLFTEDGDHTFLQVEGMELVPLSAALPETDAVLFSKFDYKVANPNGELAAEGHGYQPEHLQIALDSERIAFFYLRHLVNTITPDEKAQVLPHYRHLLDWAAHVVPQAVRGENPSIPSNAQYDSKDDIDAFVQRYWERSDVRLLHSVGENLPRVIREGSSILEHMTKDGILDNFYEEGFGLDRANEYIAEMVAQVAHRYPRMNILEIGAGTGGSTRSILRLLGSAFSTYTYTDVSGGFFSAAEDRFRDFANKMVFKTFDMNKSPAAQGFNEGSYDLILASNVLHATPDLEEMMRNARSFLKPGGFIIILEIASNDCLRFGLPMGSLPGWWVGADSGRRWGPTLTLEQWDALLQRCGFSGVDTSTSAAHKVFPGHVFCSQALDERISMLRSPLTNVHILPPTTAPQLVIIGGTTPVVHKLYEEMVPMLASRFAKIIHTETFEALHTTGLVESSTVLSLTELDDPLFNRMTPVKLESLKTLWRNGGNILWVTMGARHQNPHSYMTLGVGRCLQFEYANVTIQALDIDRIDDRTAASVAECLLRLDILDKWSKELRADELLWSLEPEVYIQDNEPVIPRLYPYDAANKRYNTVRRIVRDVVDPREASLILSNKQSWVVQLASPLRVSNSVPFAAHTRSIRLTHFSLLTVALVPGAKLMLCVGVDTESNERVVAISHTAESPVDIPSNWCAPLDQADPVSTLAGLAARIMAQSIVRAAHKGDILIVHDPHPRVADALKHSVDGKQITLFITTSTKKHLQAGWKYVDNKLPRRLVKLLLPSEATAFISLSQPTKTIGTEELIVKCLPRHCTIIDAATLFGAETQISSFVSQDEISQQFKLSLPLHNPTASKDDTASDLTIVPLQDIADYPIAPGRLAIADCTSPSVSVALRPIDDGKIFRDDKTYLLVGLSGEVGQSICKWMVLHGAINVVMTSRKPNVHPAYIVSMQNLGANVKTFSMDVTSRESVHSCHETISRTMPPIAGVANGAMILDDCLFDKLPYDSLEKVLKPKVLGSQILDELFYEIPLDFFIFFSSATAIMGNTGQSNYIAGNMFMNALATQRRNRGFAASSITISPVIGLGYVERSADLGEDTFAKMGYKPMSEQDLQQQFAEAIVLGRPDCTEVCELNTGFSPIYVDAQVKDQYMKDLKFGHFLMERPNTQTKIGKTSYVPVRVQLAEVNTREEAYEAIRESFIMRLRRILAAAPDEIINEKVKLVEQGVDSLMAVEVRSWFLKELDVDIPVLKILGGSSIVDLLEEGIRSLPTSILDIEKLDARTPQDTRASPPKEVVQSDLLPLERGLQNNALSESSSDGSPGKMSPPSVDSDDTTPLTQWKTGAILDSVNCDDAAGSEEDTRPSVGSTDQYSEAMSFGQSAFWFLNEYSDNKMAFNMAVMLKLTGSIRIGALENAVRVMGSRHETFRTRFFWSNDGKEKMPMQGISADSTVRLIRKQITTESEAEAELRNIHNEQWDLNSGDTARTYLLSVSEQVHFLLIGTHHIYLDGYSFSVFFKELEEVYNRKPLPNVPPESQYRSFASKQRLLYESGALKESIRHYRSTLPPVFEAMDLLPFAKSLSRPSIDTYSQFEASARLNQNLAAKIRQLARRNGSTSFHVYLTALQALLFRLLPATDDVFIGIADANRQDKRFMSSMGFFLNLLPLRFRRSKPGTKLAAMIKAARDSAFAALEHSRLPFDALLQELNVPRSNKYTPLFQVFLDYRQVMQERSTWGGCKVSDETWRNAATGYDVALEITENHNAEALLVLRLQASLYPEESTHLLLRSFVNVLEFMVSSHDGIVDNVPCWPPKDIEAAHAVGKGSLYETQWAPTIAHRIDDVIQTHGARIALKDGHGSNFTYEAMGARIDAITDALRAFGVKIGTVVGVFQEPSANWICSMLAIFRAGAVYVPLDLRNSVSRLSSIVKTSQPTYVLTDSVTTSKVPLRLISASHAVEIEVSSLVPSSTRRPRSLNDAKPDAPVVILFTSGSTGEPKGIVLTNANLVVNAEISSNMFATDNQDLVVLQQSPFSFDFSLDQSFAALANGGTLFVVPASHRGDPIEITKSMLNEKVSYTSGTPSEYDMWLRYGASSLRKCSSWSFAFSGGETFGYSLVYEFAALGLTQLRLFNGYGPAETTMFSTKVELSYRQPEHLPNPLPAGFMLSGYSVAIVDDNMQLLPLGVPGEIVIGGPCVVSGYLGDPRSTEDKFMPDKIFQTPWKVYRSGDRGRLLENGALFCDGRLGNDTQIKLRGFRVELTEIENTIVKSAVGALTHAVVTVRGTGEGRYLAAHVIFKSDFPNKDRDTTVQTLRRSLPLPPYMQPSVMAVLDAIPRTAHFKIDRKAVQALPLPNHEEKKDISGKLSGTELALSTLWRQVLPLDPGPLAAESDFFLVGGNSILLVKLQSLIRSVFSASPKLTSLMGATSLAEMATAVEESRQTNTIDWEMETQVSKAFYRAMRPKVRARGEGITVLLTGASGYLGRHILEVMVGDSKVRRVICPLRRVDSNGRINDAGDKVTFMRADLSRPHLDLASDFYSALVDEVDVIVHCAANRSFWDTYEALRPDNLDSVKILAGLAASSRHLVPVHFMSSGAASFYEGGDKTPLRDGSDGYVVTKWAAEIFLRRVAAVSHMPVYVHRPGSIKADARDGTNPLDVVGELTTLASKMGVGPDFEGVRGSVDIAPIGRVVEAICQAVEESTGAAGEDHAHKGVRVLNHVATVRVFVEDLAVHLRNDEVLRKLPTVPILEWFGEAKRAGFSYFMMAQDLVMGLGDKELHSRR